MKVRITRATGLSSGAVESILGSMGISSWAREVPADDTSVLADVTAQQLAELRTRYYQPHKVEVLEQPASGPPVYKHPENAAGLFVQEDGEDLYRDGIEEGHLRAANIAACMGHQDVAETILAARGIVGIPRRLAEPPQERDADMQDEAEADDEANGGHDQ